MFINPKVLQLSLLRQSIRIGTHNDGEGDPGGVVADPLNPTIYFNIYSYRIFHGSQKQEKQENIMAWTLVLVTGWLDPGW